MNWGKYNSEKQQLLNKGFKPENLFFQIGNFEDESDIEILVKDDVALTYGYEYPNAWSIGKYSNCNFANGFDRHSEIIDINEL